MSISGTPTRLRDGDWGARIKVAPLKTRDELKDDLEGATVTIRARSGKTWEARIGAVVWAGKDKYSSGHIALVSLESERRGYRRRAYGCGDPSCCDPSCQCGHYTHPCGVRCADYA